MGYTVNVGRKTQVRFIDSLNYIASKLASPQAMRSLADAFEDAISTLEVLPYAYPANDEATEALGFEVRRISVKGYGLFYYIDENTKTVEVISFLHSKQQVAQRIYRDFNDEL